MLTSILCAISKEEDKKNQRQKRWLYHAKVDFEAVHKSFAVFSADPIPENFSGLSILIHHKDSDIMTYKILHDLCPENLRHKFTERSMISEYRTRNHGDLQIPKVRLEYAKRSFYFSGVKNWKAIPDNVRERDSIARFRTGLRDYLCNLSQGPNTTPW